MVGKTFAIRKVGKECFADVVEFNFLNNPKYREDFKSPFGAKKILLLLSALAEKKLIPGTTLVFFDEVQECPEMVTAIKFLVEEGSYLFKLFMSDVRLLASQYAANIAIDLLTGKTEINNGAIYENFAAQELRAHGYNLYYFNNKKQGELDFVIEDRGKGLPIEIKSGKDYKRHNALFNVMNNEEYAIPRAIVFSNGNVQVVGKILYYPIYMLMYLQPEMIKKPIFRFEPI